MAWGGQPAFDVALARELRRRDIRLKITWEPWVAGGGAAQPRYALRRITAGRHDAYIRSYARQVARWGRVVHLRFMHEMNGSWYPWGALANGNTAADSVRAWRHVHRLFQQEGATNVRWEWAPNQVYPGSAPLRSLYPGDAYVHRVGLSAYNWGGARWTSFARLVDPTLDQLRRLTRKPLVISETGSAPTGGDRARWVRRMFEHLKTRPEVVGVTYFNHRTQRDWRIDRDAAAARAFRSGVAALP